MQKELILIYPYYLKINLLYLVEVLTQPYVLYIYLLLSSNIKYLLCSILF